MNQTAVKHWCTDLIFIHKCKWLSGTATRKDKVEPLFNPLSTSRFQRFSKIQQNWQSGYFLTHVQ